MYTKGAREISVSSFDNFYSFMLASNFFYFMQSSFRCRRLPSLFLSFSPSTRVDTLFIFPRLLYALAFVTLSLLLLFITSVIIGVATFDTRALVALILEVLVVIDEEAAAAAAAAEVFAETDNTPYTNTRCLFNYK